MTGSNKVCQVIPCIPQLPHSRPVAMHLLPRMPIVSDRRDSAVEGCGPAGCAEPAPGICACRPSVLHLLRICCQAPAKEKLDLPQGAPVSAVAKAKHLLLQKMPPSKEQHFTVPARPCSELRHFIRCSAWSICDVQDTFRNHGMMPVDCQSAPACHILRSSEAQHEHRNQRKCCD